MVSSSLIVAIVGVGGTIIASALGAYVNIRNNKERIRQENTRVAAEYYMEEKFLRLLKLYKINSQLSSFATQVISDRRRHTGETTALTGEGITEANIDDFDHVYREWREAANDCEIFLDEIQKKILNKCSIAHMEVFAAVEESGQEVSIDWNKIENSPAVQQLGLPIDAFRIHTRLVGEMLEHEINKRIDYFDVSGDPNSDERPDWQDDFEENYNSDVEMVFVEKDSPSENGGP